MSLPVKTLLTASSAYFLTFFLLSTLAFAVKVQFLPQPAPFFIMLFAGFTTGLVRNVIHAAVTWAGHAFTLLVLRPRLSALSTPQVRAASITSAYVAILLEFPLWFGIVRMPVRGLAPMVVLQGILVTIVVFEVYRAILLRGDADAAAAPRTSNPGEFSEQ